MMKKVLGLFLVLAMLISFEGNVIHAYAQESYPSLAEYKIILTELNVQFGTELKIPIENEDIVYESLKSKTLDEFRIEMTKMCQAALEIKQDFMDEDGKITIDMKNGTFEVGKNQTFSVNKTPISTNSIREQVTQRCKIEKDLYIINVFMNAEILSGTGNSGNYVYSSILGVGYTDSPTKAYFLPTSHDESLSSNKKTCTITYYGNLTTKSGVVVLPAVSISKVKVNFTAEGTNGNGTIM
ncbi:MAG: hypothetical protein ACERKN_10945 [Velocimicrobium sp.]